MPGDPPPPVGTPREWPNTADMEGQSEAHAAERAYALASRNYPDDPAKAAEACAAYDTMVRLSLASSAQILLGPVQAEAGG